MLPERHYEVMGRRVRVTVDVDGAPVFVISDVAGLLGYRDAANAARLLRDHQRGYSLVSTQGGMQRMLTCTESGLNRLVLRSNSANAEQVQDWVESVVLPSIRQTGSYAAEPVAAQPRELSRLELIDMARDSELGRLAAVERAEVLQERNARLEPAAAMAEELISADGDYSLREAAQVLSRDYGIDTGQNRLLRRLRSMGWVDGNSRPYQSQITLGRLSVRTRTWEDTEGDSHVSVQVRVTPKGLAWLHQHWPDPPVAAHLRVI